MRRLWSAVVAATLIVSMLQGGIPAARAGGGETVSYLALGTSLTVGYQPGRGETAKGYVDDLRRSMQQQIPGLTLRNVGCPGETSRSMISGKHSLCHYAAGSQLDAAVAFLEAHPGQVAFITLEVGANDLVERCLPGHRPARPGVRGRPAPPAADQADAHRRCLGGRGGTGRADRRHDLLRPVPRVLGSGSGRSRAGAGRPTGLGDAEHRVHDRVLGRRGHGRGCGGDLPDRRLHGHDRGARPRPDPRERRPHVPVDVVLLAEVRRRPAREPDGLPEDRAHVRPGAPSSAAVAWTWIFPPGTSSERRPLLTSMR